MEWQYGYWSYDNVWCNDYFRRYISSRRAVYCNVDFGYGWDYI